ncbi:hypothetical protein PNEG_03531 [Pneumocystis murina B123]|uniref:Methyltransferase type 11 domain-containing protein n=1 Tax=Pneumocystis murina (strain B123) TaxID=1069680 RepID=M7NLS5_PNEMU|nr:hypothetical protein PNEG_03531 [Pneumocystis murina B123]EMR08091.1 hypothetical protein PNEG_03531 [Pneumocystis murina B123]
MKDKDDIEQKEKNIKQFKKKHKNKNKTLKTQNNSILHNISTPCHITTSETIETSYVHNVYSAIAGHFSATRQKPWPTIENYLLKQPTGALGLDVGCGNGRYLFLSQNIFLIGIDRCEALLQIAKEAGEAHVILGDARLLPVRPIFDFAISIAVIHHLTIEAHRIDALRQLLTILRPGGTALVSVWALEQPNSRRGWNECSPQDILVPWISYTKAESPDNESRDIDQKDRVVETKIYQRYYHLFRKGELEEYIKKAGGEVIESGFERDNWWAQMQLKVNKTNS